MHYYQFNIKDYKAHTEHLDELEDLAYRRMIDWCYLHECGLPADVDEIARLIRMRTHCECIATVLKEFFCNIDDEYLNKHIDADIQKYKEKSDKARHSANARWNKKKIKVDANALRTECEGNANNKPLTINQELLTINISEFWKVYKKGVNKKGCEPIWNKLKVDQPLFEKMTNHIEIQFRNTERKYWPKPKDYLTGERWNDDIIDYTDLKPGVIDMRNREAREFTN
jgi:uncharacterized protein YdaU (DUF1376 family)